MLCVGLKSPHCRLENLRSVFLNLFLKDILHPKSVQNFTWIITTVILSAEPEVWTQVLNLMTLGLT